MVYICRNLSFTKFLVIKRTMFKFLCAIESRKPPFSTAFAPCRQQCIFMKAGDRIQITILLLVRRHEKRVSPPHFADFLLDPRRNHFMTPLPFSFFPFFDASTPGSTGTDGPLYHILASWSITRSARAARYHFFLFLCFFLIIILVFVTPRPLWIRIVQNPPTDILPFR